MAAAGGAASSTGPSYTAAASASASCGSCHGGTWVSTSRFAPERRGHLAALGAGQVQVRRVVAAGAERRLGQQQVGVAGEVLEPAHGPVSPV